MRPQSALSFQCPPERAVAHVPPGPDPDTPDDPDLPDDPDRGGDLPEVNPGGNPDNPGDNPAVREPGHPAEVVAAVASFPPWRVRFSLSA